MKDVAAKAGVSIATVSAVINNTKYVTRELKVRVLDAVDKLNYRPNRIAQSLKTRESKLIGVTVTEITNPFYPHMLKGVEQTVSKFGYQLLLSTTEDNEEKELKLIQSMCDQGVDAMILATIDNNDSKILKLLDEKNMNYVLINRSPPNFRGSCFVPNSYKVGVIATNFLIQLGHKNIGFVGGKRQNSFYRERGFRDTMILNKLYINEKWIFDGLYSVEGAYAKAKELISRGNLPTALFVANDLMAFGVIKALLDEGYGVPEDISVIGSDNIVFTEDFRIPLTTIDVGKYEMGLLASRYIMDLLLKTNTPNKKQELIEPQLIIRDSTSHPRD